MPKDNKNQGLIIHRGRFLTNYFWQGVADGFGCTGYLLGSCRNVRLRVRGDSVYEAWAEVGDVLTDAMAEYAHGQSASDLPEQGTGRSRRERRDRAYAR
jgi:hypothetical protein